MSSGILGTLLASAGAGYDYQNALDRQTEIYQDQRQRQKTADARSSLTFNQGQEKYQHDLARRPVLEEQEDERAAATTKGLGLRNALEQNTVDRLPTTNAQQDQAFATEQKLRNSQIGNVSQEQALRALQIKQQQLGLDDATLAHHVAQNQRVLVSAYQASAQSGDYTKFVQAYNDTIGHTIGHNITGLKQNQDGTFSATQEGGEPLQFKSAQDMLNGALSMNDPSLMVHSLYEQHAAAAEAAQARAKDPKKFSELVRGEDGTLGNVDLSTNQFVPLTDQQGNPLRGTLAGKARTGVANDAAEAFYAQRLRANDTPARALEATRNYMATFHPGARGAWNQPPTQAAPGGAATPTQPTAVGTPANRAMPPVQGARQAPDGNWYVPDPQRPGKFLKVN